MINASERLLFMASHLYQGIKGQKPAVMPLRILIVKYDEIGDIVCALPVIEKLIQTYPIATMDVLCKPYGKDIFEAIEGINIVYTAWPQNVKYNWIIDLRSSWQLWFRIVRANPSFYLGRGRVRWMNKGNQKHEIYTNEQIVQVLTLQESAKRWKTDSLRIQLPTTKYAIIHAGARRVLRQWPIENYTDLSKYLHQKHGIHSIYIGAGKEEMAIIEKIIAPLGAEICTNMVDALKINEVAKWIKNAKLFIGNESGPLQIADYWGIRSLSFFGPGVPKVFYPRTAGSQILHHILDCNPCNQINCSQDIPCIEKIQIMDAKISLDKILQ